MDRDRVHGRKLRVGALTLQPRSGDTVFQATGGNVDFEVSGTRVLRLGADKRLTLAIGTLKNNLDADVAVCPANTADMTFYGLVTGRVVSPIDLLVQNSAGAADLYVRGSQDARISLQPQNGPAWNFHVPAGSRQLVLNNVAGTLQGSVETPVLRLGYNSPFCEILADSRVGTTAKPQDLEVTGTLR